MPVALHTLPAVSPTWFSVRLLWALADFSDCSSIFTVRVSFLPHSDLCSIFEMTSLPHGCIISHSSQMTQKLCFNYFSQLLALYGPVVSDLRMMFPRNSPYFHSVGNDHQSPHFSPSIYVSKYQSFCIFMRDFYRCMSVLRGIRDPLRQLYVTPDNERIGCPPQSSSVSGWCAGYGCRHYRRVCGEDVRSMYSFLNPSKYA